jgi:hypothetical protein
MSDISKYTVVETKGWKHEYSDRLFQSKDEADCDWAVYAFKHHVGECITYNEFDADAFISRIATQDDLRHALQLLSILMEKYPRT